MDLIESVKKLDVQSNSILVLRTSPCAETAPLQMAVEKLAEWLVDQDLDGVQIFIVAGNGFDVDMMTNAEMNSYGWFRKDDL